MENQNTTTPTTPVTPRPLLPVGPGFTIETMREIAQRYGATSFVEHIPTDASDVGYILNPADTPNQFGVATYQTAQGFTVTHSITAYVPAVVRSAVTTTAGQSARSATPAIFNIDVIDISVPYRLPHVVVLPWLYEGVSRFLQMKKPTWGSRDVTTVELEGDFSEFVTAFTLKGEEVDAFVYLAPNVMELVLERSTDYTIEFIDNHIYMYYRQSDARQINVNAGQNTFIDANLHESMLQTGLAIADSLARAARPASEPSQAPKVMPKPSTIKAIVGAFWPLALVLLSFSITPSPLIITLPLAVIVYGSRYIRETRRYNRYQERYGRNAQH